MLKKQFTIVIIKSNPLTGQMTITEVIGPFNSDLEASKYIAEGHGPKDAAQTLVVPLSPLGLYVHPKFPRLTPMEE